MRRTKLQMTMAVFLTAVLLGGCGEEPYSLTEQEENLIVNYSAHVVTKYNTYQKEGLTYVWPEETEEAESGLVTPVVSDNVDGAVSAQTGADAATTDDTQDGSAIVYDANAVTLTELFGESGVELDYIGARLAGSYIKDQYYALYPDSGKQYLVLGIDVTNTGKTTVAVDYLSKDAKYQVTLNGDTTCYSELTILMDDFSTFEAKLAPGATRETVLLFQVPETITSIESINLVVTTDESYQIILENE